MSSGGLAGLSMGGSAVNAYGQIQQSQAQSQASLYNAQIAQMNSGIATQQATWAGQEGVQQASSSEMKTAATYGSTQANQGASGVTVGTGSSADVLSSEKELGMLDALTIRSNAARQAYGYQTQAVSDTAQSNLDTFAAKNDITAGQINATSTILGGAAKAAASYNPFQSFMGSNSVIDTGSAVNSGALASDASVLAGA